MDKEWVFLDRNCDEYISGLRAFINHSVQLSRDPNKIICPCKDCKNRWRKTIKEVEDHIRCVGMWNDYVNRPWTEHGEQLSQIDPPNVNVPSSPHQAMADYEMTNMLEDAFGFHDETALPHAPSDPIGGQDSGPTPDAQKFYELLDDANTDLFPGARINKLEFWLRLYQIKCLHSNSDVSFTETLELLRDLFPVSSTLKREAEKERAEAAQREQRIRAEAEEYRNEATMREERIRAEAAEREQRFTAEMDKFRREHLAIMQENARMVEQKAAIQLGRWMKEAGFSGIDTATQGNVEPMTQVTSMQPQNNIPVVETPGMNDEYSPEISGSIQDTQMN